MATPSELKQMVSSFRVSELQVLLGYAGRSKTGKKHELMSRSLGLVERGCSTPLQIKIRELYKRRFPTGAPSTKTQSPASSSNNSSSTSSRGHSSPSRGHPPYPHSSINPSHTPAYPSQYSENSVDEITARKRPDSGHSSGLDFSRNASQIPVNPDVRFKPLPFYDKLGELLKPSSLVPRNSSRFQEIFFIFHLTPQQASDVGMSRELSPHGIEEYSVQIQLRFCLLETTCEQKDEFPPSICVRVNGKIAPLPNPIPTNKQGVEPKRPSRPVNITHICRLSSTVSNHINISWASELGRSYCVCVDLVRKLNSDILLQRTKARGTKHPDHTTALIKEKLAHNPDSEITTTSLRCSLNCPLGKMRMAVPGRAITCNHVQCFDLPMFLQMNEKKPTWVCPVCDRPAEFKNLIVDGLFTQILKSAADSCEIQFSEDGSWKPSKQRDDADVCDSPEPVHMIGDETPGASKLQKKTEEASASCDVIDLTESDDDAPVPIAEINSSDSSSSSVIAANQSQSARWGISENKGNSKERQTGASEASKIEEIRRIIGGGSVNSPVLLDDTMDTPTTSRHSPMCISPRSPTPLSVARSPPRRDRSPSPTPMSRRSTPPQSPSRSVSPPHSHSASSRRSTPPASPSSSSSSSSSRRSSPVVSTSSRRSVRRLSPMSDDSFRERSVSPVRKLRLKRRLTPPRSPSLSDTFSSEQSPPSSPEWSPTSFR